MKSFEASTGAEFAGCNKTELYQLCRRAGLHVTPSTSREDMTALLLGIKEPTAEENPIDSWRLAIMKFLLDHWSKVHSQLTCPAKSGDPNSCFQCVDAHVVTCVVQNAASEQQIQQHLVQLRRKVSS